MLDFLTNNWAIVVAAIAFGASVVVAVSSFIELPTKSQLDKVREWLLWAVTEAEKDLGSGTGALKLRSVYDLFVLRFPWLAKVISFETFSQMVDEALDEMRELLDTNEAVSAFVNGADIV